MIHLSHRFFADCEASYADAAYAVFGVPYDATGSYKPGMRFGPREIREISYNFEPYLPEYDLDLSSVPCTDMGDLETPVGARAMAELVEELVQGILSDGKIPIMLGGEHSITTGAVRAHRPDCYVVCDAHLDLRDEFHGEAYNHACTTRRVYDDGVENIVIIGARSGIKEEWDLSEQMHVFTADMVREMGISRLVREVADIIGDLRTYLSIDADVIDCCLTPGLGTPEPFGLTPLDIREIVSALAPSVSAFDYVEVCPCDQGQTACVAAKIIRGFIASHWLAGQP